MYKYYIKTFGCRLNISESESMIYELKLNNFITTENKEEAQFFIINSCTVTEKADKKVKSFINSIRKYKKSIIITGCGNYKNDIENKVFFIDNKRKGNIINFILNNISDILNNGIFGNISNKNIKKENLLKYNLINNYLNNKNEKSEINENRFFKPSLESLTHTKAFLKIQDGCNQQCTYCKVRFVRGNSVSLNHQIILDYLQKIKDSGFKDVVLTGINLASYNDGEFNFSNLLNLITEKYKDLNFTISSIEVNYLDNDFYKIIERENIKPYFHLPLQSGSQKILELMKRNYSIDYYKEKVLKIKEVKKDSFISTDIIVGFPGESDYDFKETLKVINEIKYSFLHIFPFSFREETIAYQFYKLNEVDKNIIKKRLEIIQKLNEELNKNYIEKILNKKLKFYNKILVEDIYFKDSNLIIEGSNYYNIKSVVNISLDEKNINLIKLFYKDLVNNSFNFYKINEFYSYLNSSGINLNKDIMIKSINFKDITINKGDYFLNESLIFKYKKDLKERKGYLYASWN
jgi:threonylcarbamoyladenosine tRNA methylthiotransferase MtaB